MNKIDVYTNALRQAGYRVTTQRQVICEYLAHTQSHPTPYQIYDDLTRAHPEISRATVYNTLHVLQSLGVIVEIGLGMEHTHYETDPAPHVNLICLRCHRIIDYPGPLPLDELRQQLLVETTGFQPVTGRMDVLGFCQECRERRRSEIVAAWNTRHALPLARAEEPKDGPK